MAMPGKRILLVEDEPLVRDLLAHNLHAEGYRIDAVGTAADARARLAGQRYALVIADWRLPDGDGTQIADAAAARGAKTLVMSAYLLQMPAQHEQRYETMMKPIRPAEMLAAVTRSIGAAGSC
jgi:two-component system, OmpR family, response regulator